MRYYIGWDSVDQVAYNVAVASLRKHASIDVTVIPIWDDMLRERGLYSRTHEVIDSQKYDTSDGKAFSTAFSFARFGVILIELAEGDGDEWVLFTDPDVLWRGDIAELMARADDRYAVMCVQHNHKPREDTKMLGKIQTTYRRKNWSSMMLIKPARCRGLTLEALNTWRGSMLHALEFVRNSEIGEISEKWNWLVGISPTCSEPPDWRHQKLIHFTLGTPDMPGRATAEWAAEWRSYLDEPVAAGRSDPPS